MEALLKNEVVRTKIKGLSPPVKKAFIESLLDLYEQETEEMIDVIEESRMELRGDFLSFEDESKSLRAESRMLEEKRGEHDKACVDRYVQSRNGSRSSESRLSYIDEQTNSKAVKEYIRNRGKRRPPLAEEMKRCHSTDRPADRRADSVLSTRSLPTPATLRTVEEEKDEVMKNLTAATRQNEAERQRQAELIAQRREKRMQQKKTTEEKALELLEKAVAMDKMLQERKQEQSEKLKMRLEDKQRQRAESRMGSHDRGSQNESRDRKADTKANGKERSKTSDKKGKSESEEKSKQEKTSDKKGKSESEEKSKQEKSHKSDKTHTSDKKDKVDKKEDRKEKDKKTADYDFTIY